MQSRNNKQIVFVLVKKNICIYKDKYKCILYIYRWIQYPKAFNPKPLHVPEKHCAHPHDHPTIDGFWPFEQYGRSYCCHC